MKIYGYNLDATHQAIIFEEGSEASDRAQCHNGYTPGLIVGASEWGWIKEDNARRICAALSFFSETSTEDLEQMKEEKFKSTMKSKPLKLEEGKYYVRRDGGLTGPLKHNKDRAGLYDEFFDPAEKGMTWADDGDYHPSGFPHPFDIIVETIEIPSSVNPPTSAERIRAFVGEQKPYTEEELNGVHPPHFINERFSEIGNLYRNAATPTEDVKRAAGDRKCPMHLIPTALLEPTAFALKKGSLKYGQNNWRASGVNASTYVAAILRHLTAWRDGEDNDPESGVSHLGHVAASCAIVLDCAKHGVLRDDRGYVEVKND